MVGTGVLVLKGWPVGVSLRRDLGISSPVSPKSGSSLTSPAISVRDSEGRIKPAEAS